MQHDTPQTTQNLNPTPPKKPQTPNHIHIQVEISRSYGLAEWQEDLRRLCRRAGAEDRPVAFLFGDAQAASHPAFVEDVNSLLNSGEVRLGGWAVEGRWLVGRLDSRGQVVGWCFSGAAAAIGTPCQEFSRVYVNLSNLIGSDVTRRGCGCCIQVRVWTRGHQPVAALYNI